MKHIHQKGFHIMCKCIHAGGSSNKSRQVHREQRVCENDTRQEFRRKKNFFLVCFIVRNNRASSHFTSGTCRCWNSNKRGNVICHKYITALQIIVLEKIFTMIYAKSDGSCHIQGSSTTNSDGTIPFFLIKNIGSLINIRLHRILMDLIKSFYRDIPAL